MRTLLCLLAVALVGRGVAQQAGDLDLSFDGDGRLVIDVLPAADPRMVSLPDGGLVVAVGHGVSGTPTVSMVRLAEDGSLVPSIWANGLLTLTSVGTLIDIHVQSDGKLLVIGRNTGGFVPVGNDIVIERYNMDGGVDSTYGVDGRCVLELPETSLSLNDALVGPGDALYLCGGRQNVPFICRFTAEGILDPSFGTDGFRMGDLPVVTRMVLISTGHIEFINQSTGPYRIPWNGVGAVINHFCGDPGVIGYAQRLVVNPYDQSMTCYTRYFSIPGSFMEDGVVRRTSNGVNLSGWGNTTCQQTYMFSSVFGEGLSGRVHALGADQAGNFFVGCHYFNNPGWRLYRMSSFGPSWDPGFGAAGQVTTAFDSTTAEAIPTRINTQMDGKIVMAGQCMVYGTNRVVLARYHNIPDPRSTLSLRIFLGGAYDASTGLMRDDLRQQALLPTLQPYGPPFYPPANGVGVWAVPQHVLDMEGEDAVVDWVWLELINASDSSNVMATRVGLVHRNGIVTSADGHSPIDFSAGAGSYFVRVRHRNHLGVTIAEPLTLGASVTTVDLTDPATITFGTDAQQEVNGVRMLWPGDATSDAAIKYVGPFNDRDKILVAIGGSNVNAVLPGYRTEDVNLDGVVKYVGTANDRDVILQVLDGSINAVRLEQRP
ncbi:MAG: hypothetical protein IPP83_05365 [Flavobacteriales bacterium]|nr:hypothetical protein [Flavobacteriales bacterium]